MNNCNSELNKNKSQTTKNKTERTEFGKIQGVHVSKLGKQLWVALMLEKVGDPWHMEKEEVHEREEYFFFLNVTWMSVLHVCFWFNESSD